MRATLGAFPREDAESHEQDLTGLTALVTGSTSGIGRTVAQELARGGAEVIVHGRDAARSSDVADAITADGGRPASSPPT